MEQNGKIKILVVEDDISLKDSLVRLLQTFICWMCGCRTAMGLISVMKSGKFHRRL